MKSLLGGSRVGTVRKRVRAAEKLSRWLWLTRQRRWPQHAADVVDYLHASMAEAPWLSFPRELGRCWRGWPRHVKHCAGLTVNGANVAIAIGDDATNQALTVRAEQKNSLV